MLQVRAVTGYGDRVQAGQASEADLRDLTVKMTNMAGIYYICSMRVGEK